MSETKSLAAPKASFDRRSVVKGAAWSVPVIAAAIAAPAAAASTPIPPTVALAGYTNRTVSPASKTLSAPTGIFIYNTTGASPGSDNVAVTVKITRDSVNMPGIFIGSLGGVTGSVGAYVNNEVAITFSIPVARSSAAQSFDFGSFTHNGNGNSVMGTYSMTVDVLLPAPTGKVSTSSPSTQKLTLSGK